MRHHRNWREPRLYRDPQHGKLMGVCAGAADYFGWNVTATRILAIIALLWFSGLTVVAYLILGFVLPTRSDTLYDCDNGEEYWRGARRPMGDAFRTDARHHFREPNMKLQPMEGYVTSSRYDLDRQFRDLEH